MKKKILHLGDLHVKEGERFDQTIACIEHAIGKAKEIRPDVIIIPGDIFDAKSTILERNTFAGFAVRLADIAPLVILYGNHDRPGDLDIFDDLEAMHSIQVVSNCKIIPFDGLAVFCLPHISKATFSSMADGELSAEMTDLAMVQFIRTYLQGLREQTKSAKIPTVFASHCTIEGSMLSNGETSVGHGISLNLSDIDIGADAYLLNHIHKFQEFTQIPAAYAGSIAPTNWGESKEEKGLLLWEVGDGETTKTFIPSPSRRMLTFDVSYLGREDAKPGELKTWDFSPYMVDPAEIKGSEIRLRLSFPSDRRIDAEGFSQDCEQVFNDYGAHSVKTELRAIAVSRVRSANISDAPTLKDKLHAGWEVFGNPEGTTPENADAMLAEIEGEMSCN